MAEMMDQIATRVERSCGWIVKQVFSDLEDQEEQRRRMTLE